MARQGLPFLRHAFRRSLWPLWDRRTMWAILGLLSLVGGLYLWQAGQIASIQYRIRTLAEERENWRIWNTQLQKRIAEHTRVSTLTERVQELGFIRPQEEVYLGDP